VATAQYLDDFKVKNLVSRYSEFVNFPIKIWSSKTNYEQASRVFAHALVCKVYRACKRAASPVETACGSVSDLQGLASRCDKAWSSGRRVTGKGLAGGCQRRGMGCAEDGVRGERCRTHASGQLCAIRHGAVGSFRDKR
jgi:hypothetical protein